MHVVNALLCLIYVFLFFTYLASIDWTNCRGRPVGRDLPVSHIWYRLFWLFISYLFLYLYSQYIFTPRIIKNNITFIHFLKDLNNISMHLSEIIKISRSAKFNYIKAAFMIWKGLQSCWCNQVLIWYLSEETMNCSATVETTTFEKLPRRLRYNLTEHRSGPDASWL